jgi:DNA-directed RNA polymerase specialized sigma24 family protein
MKADEAFTRFARDWAAFIERWTKRLIAQGHGSSADGDDLRQAALIAAWEGYREWQQLPEEERDPRLLPLMIPRRIKDAMLKERQHVLGTRAFSGGLRRIHRAAGS